MNHTQEISSRSLDNNKKDNPRRELKEKVKTASLMRVRTTLRL